MVTAFRLSICEQPLNLGKCLRKLELCKNSPINTTGKDRCVKQFISTHGVVFLFAFLLLISAEYIQHLQYRKLFNNDARE